MSGVNDTFVQKVNIVSQDCSQSLAENVQRYGSRIGSTFVDGGVHPCFGARNFTRPLQNGQYLEVVCTIDHPSTKQTPQDKAVGKKTQEGEGWLTWLLATEDNSHRLKTSTLTAKSKISAHFQMEATLSGSKSCS